MQIPDTPYQHRWDLTPTEAVALQRKLRDAISVQPLDLQKVNLVAGADCAFSPDGEEVIAGIVVYRLSDGASVEEAVARVPLSFPYVPGLLSFREMPGILAAWEKLTVRPDVLMCDAQGYSHPRRFGLACHAGLWLDLPTLGAAKSRLIGTHEPLGDEPGSQTPLMDKGEVIGQVVRTKIRTNPIFVSVGHRIDLPSAIELMQKCLAGKRLPEPTRRAHERVTLERKGNQPDDSSQGALSL